MKLYATVTSERASKGQGGNEWLAIKLTTQSGGVPHEIGIVRLAPTETPGGCILSLDRSSYGRDKGGTVYGEVIEIKR